jgi:hypothetical protein
LCLLTQGQPLDDSDIIYRRGSVGLMGKNNISSPSWLDAADLSICVWKKGTKHPKSWNQTQEPLSDGSKNTTEG